MSISSGLGPPGLGSAADPLVGRLLEGRYRLDAVVARGGMATVYRGHDERLDRVVAVKVMHRALADDAGFVAKFTQEARSAARLTAPEVVAVHDQGTDPQTGAAFLVMEYIAGRTMRDLLRERGALPPAQALALLEPVLTALAAAHAAGLVHRDVKPENVLLGDDGRIKVADFGLARAVAASGLTATTGVLLGTVAYLAPEQVEHGITTERSDVYAAGVMLWEALTGAPPYTAETQVAVALSHVTHDVPLLSTVVPGIPAGLDDLVCRATRRDPAGRPADAGAFLAELQVVRSDLPAGPLVGAGRRPPAEHPTLVVTLPPRVPARLVDPATAQDAQPPVVHPVAPGPVAGGRRPRRHGPAWAALIVVLAALLAVGGWYLGSGRYTAAPGVLGLSQVAAVQRLQAAGLHSRQGPAVFDEQVPTGLVVRQDPPTHGRVLRGGTVVLVLSKGVDLRAVPTVVGLAEAAARGALGAVGLTTGPVTQDYSATVAAGLVVSSDPGAGARLRARSVVALVLSRGPAPVAVADVRGKPQGQALQLLQDAGLTGTVTQGFSDTVPAGVVISQTPLGGTAARGSAVALVVSKGPDLVVVPSVTGLAVGDAKAALTSVGLANRVFSIPGPGTVREQDPSPGTQLRRGATVTLYVF